MADDFPSDAKGPLDELVPGLRRKAERFPALPVHPRVVHTRSPAGERSIVLASFAPAANVRALHAALKPLIEAALLAELSRPGSMLAEDDSRLDALELYAFAAPPFNCAPALTPFGFERADLDAPEALRALALLRGEAQLVDGAADVEPLARYRARFVRATHPLAGALHARLARAVKGEPWGVAPGTLARAAADTLRELGHAGVEPTRQGIERLEEVIVPREHGVVRWVEPLLFQALCDLVGVMAASSPAGLGVQWGVCEPDPDSGLCPPPILRVERGSDIFHVPLGEHVLRWCVMPSAPGEVIPTLGAWAEHEFA